MPCCHQNEFRGVSNSPSHFSFVVVAAARHPLSVGDFHCPLCHVNELKWIRRTGGRRRRRGMGWTAEGTDGISGMGNGEAEAAAAVAVGLLSVYYSCTCAVSLPPSSPFWSVVHPAASARAARITGTRARRTRRGGGKRKKIRNAPTQ